MNAHQTCLAIATRLFTQAGLNGCHIYAQDREILGGGPTDRIDKFELPAVMVEATAESLCGSGSIGRMRVTITVESQSDTDTAHTHSLREKAIRDAMADTAGLTAAFASLGNVALLGPACLRTLDPNVEARAWLTPYTYTLGVRSV